MLTLVAAAAQCWQLTGAAFAVVVFSFASTSCKPRLFISEASWLVIERSPLLLQHVYWRLPRRTSEHRCNPSDPAAVPVQFCPLLCSRLTFLLRPVMFPPYCFSLRISSTLLLTVMHLCVSPYVDGSACIRWREPSRCRDSWLTDC